MIKMGVDKASDSEVFYFSRDDCRISVVEEKTERPYSADSDDVLVVLSSNSRGTSLTLTAVDAFSKADALYDALRTYEHFRRRTTGAQSIYNQITEDKRISFGDNVSHIDVHHPEYSGDTENVTVKNKHGSDIKDMLIENMYTKTERPKNVLIRNGYEYISEIPTSRNKLKSLKGMGDGSVDQIMDFLASGAHKEASGSDESKTPIDAMVTKTNRPKNALKRNGIKYVEDIPEDRQVLLNMKSMGKGSVDQIMDYLKGNK